MGAAEDGQAESTAACVLGRRRWAHSRLPQDGQWQVPEGSFARHWEQVGVEPACKGEVVVTNRFRVEHSNWEKVETHRQPRRCGVVTGSYSRGPL